MVDDQEIKSGIWPDFIAPAQYENPAEGWIDPRLPDFRAIWEVARSCGYGIGLHGSMKRDCDLIAVPWTEEATHPVVLIEALCQRLNARQVDKIEQKPQNRIAVSLQVDGYVKIIDLSIWCPYFETEIFNERDLTWLF